MQQTLKIEPEPGTKFVKMPTARPVRLKSMPRARLRHLVAAAQDGDRCAYRQFLVEACQHLENFYTGMLVRSERERIIDLALLAIHEKLGTCDTARPVRPWIEAIAEYRRKQAKQPLILSGHLIEFEEHTGC